MERGGDVENGRPDKQHTQAPRVFPPSRSTKIISSAGPAWRRGREIAIYASLRGSALAVWPAVAPTPDFMDDFRAFLGGEHSVLLRQSLCKEVLQLPSPHIFFFTNVLFFWQKNEQQPQTTWASLQAISPRGKLGGGRSASKGGRRSEFVKKKLDMRSVLLNFRLATTTTPGNFAYLSLPFGSSSLSV